MDVIKQLSLVGLVPVIKVEDAADAVPLCRALANGGLPVAEITFRSDAAEEAIRRVHEELPEVILGAGTVLTTEQVDRAVAAGASYIVSPGINPTIVRYCQEKGVPIVPGTANPSNVETALELGLKTVKFFPAEAVGGLKMIKAMSAPYGDVTFLPTGGINEKNVKEYLAFPRIIAVGGSWMAPGDAVKAKDWNRIEALARGAVELVLGLELKHIGINSGNADQAMRDAALLCRLTGWQVKEGPSSAFAGDAFECVKKVGRGKNGHIALAANSVERARWHLERRGFAFDEDSAVYADGRLTCIYLRDEIAGFAIHLSQK